MRWPIFATGFNNFHLDNTSFPFSPLFLLMYDKLSFVDLSSLGFTVLQLITISEGQLTMPSNLWPVTRIYLLTSCFSREIQYVVLSNIATMTIRQKVFTKFCY